MKCSSENLSSSSAVSVPAVSIKYLMLGFSMVCLLSYSCMKFSCADTCPNRRPIHMIRKFLNKEVLWNSPSKLRIYIELPHHSQRK